MKQWQAPKLIVLTRTHPAESVLTACKHLHVGDAPIDTFPGCATGYPGGCTGCETQVQS